MPHEKMQCNRCKPPKKIDSRSWKNHQKMHDRLEGKLTVVPATAPRQAFDPDSYKAGFLAGFETARGFKG